MKRYRHLFMILLAVFVLLIIPGKANASTYPDLTLDSGTYEGINWKITATWNGVYERTLTISGNGPIPDFDHPNDGCAGDVLPPWLRCRWTAYEDETPDSYQRSDYFKGMGSQYGSNFTHIIIEPGITSIGDYAFCPSTFQCSYSYSNISEIVIPDTVTKIGRQAFYSWRYLGKVVIPDSVTEIDWPGTETPGWAAMLPFDQHTTIAASGKSTAYNLLSSVYPMEITDLDLEFAVDGETDTVTLKPGQTVPYTASTNYSSIPVNVYATTNSSAVSIDTANGTITALNGGTTAVVTASAGSKRISVNIKVLGEYPISYYLDGGTNNKANPGSATEGTVVKLKSPSKKGYKFLGWYTSYTGGSKVTKVNDTAYLYARWKPVTVGKVKNLKVTNKKTRKAVISFNKVSGAKGYRVQYSTKSSFKASATKSKNITKRSLTLKKLTKKKTYYIRVQAYKIDSANKKVYGKWSKVVKVKIKK